jgi:aminoglycoside N3'-acetyltransferase
MFTVEQVAEDLARLGVRRGQALMVHASLRRLGPVEGGARGVIAALEAAVGPAGGLLMTLGATDDLAWVNERPEAERAGLLARAEPFDPLSTPADPDVGWLAEVFRREPGTRVTDNPEGRFGARGGLAEALLADAPWDAYYGPGSPLAHLVELGGAVLRLGADPDTVTLLHLAEYLAPVEAKRRVRRHRRVLGPTGPEIRTVECLDDSDGIVDWPGDDYFKTILEAYLATGRAREGPVGSARSELLDARDLTAFAVDWMARNLNRA